MSSEKTLTVVEQREVEFYDGHIYVSVRHMCDALGLSRPAQVRRIRRSEILDEGYKGGAKMAPPSAEGRGGGMQEAGLLRVDLVPAVLGRDSPVFPVANVGQASEEEDERE